MLEHFLNRMPQSMTRHNRSFASSAELSADLSRETARLHAAWMLRAAQRKTSAKPSSRDGIAFAPFPPRGAAFLCRRRCLGAEIRGTTR
jgi:hypothetical protein